MEKPERAVRSDLPDLTGTSLEELREHSSDHRERAKQRLLKTIGRPTRSASPGTGNSWVV
ncbi:hypothetical protein ACQEVY_31705 [Streptomyces sp. CA-288835]|uniref:hypothetical protein n=1 Tax=Streptomyces sp. CA-288835 TaxID=3240069 RepID=UPI003D8FA049